MGPRPPDFDEELVRRAPTFIRWMKLRPGQKLRYACRDFLKGHGDDEERLMRRIMIARRNNLRDHAILKRARASTEPGAADEQSKEKVICESTEDPPQPKKKRGNPFAMTDEEVMREMDVPAVEATRSFKAWLELEDGQDFTYNQKYIKGREGHEWLLKKNIWRRMRYRRENKKMVEKMKGNNSEDVLHLKYEVVDETVIPEHSYSSAAAVAAASAATHIVDHALPTNLLAGAEVTNMSDAGQDDDLHDAVVEAAVAAAESYVKLARESDTSEMKAVAQSPMEHSTHSETSALSVHNPIMSVPATSVAASTLGDGIGDHHHTPNPLVGFENALDVAAKLAAAASAVNHVNEEFNDAVEANTTDDAFISV